jgi:hypothetical protein
MKAVNISPRGQQSEMKNLDALKPSPAKKREAQNFFQRIFDSVVA